MKRPNPILYWFLGSLLLIFAFFKGQRIVRLHRIKRGAIVLSNHTSFYDFIYTTTATFPHRVNYLAVDKMFYEPVAGFFMRLARAIPKPLFESDPSSIKKAFQVLNHKGIIGIFPEGQISAIGSTLPISKAIAKFIKKAQVNVYIVLHKGAYFVNPPWSKKTFRGRVDSTVSLLFSPSDIESKSIDEIHQAIQEALNFQSGEYVRKNQLLYKANDIANLENVVFQCPKCSTHGLISRVNHLYCPTCDSAFHGFVHGLLGKYPLEEVFLKQTQLIRRHIDESPNFEISANVALESYLDKRLCEVGKGVLTLNRQTYRYVGTMNGELIDKVFSTKVVPTLPSDIGRNVQIYENKIIYQFRFDEIKYMPQYFVHAGEYIYQLQQIKG
ncbi:MAG: lysophospholipid acyltransferase family protein [bacterium]|nr:lysophospholipid acyltransferase family protein [bacterium]